MQPRIGGVTDPIAAIPPEKESSRDLDYAYAVEQFYEDLSKFAFGLAGNENDAEDLTQDTYHVLLTKGDAIRDSRKVKSWLFTTLYRLFLGQRRHTVRFPEMPVESAECELPTIPPQHVEMLDGSIVVAALNQLDEAYRAPLTLFYLEELSYKQMAEVLGVPIGTIMSRLSRGKEALRRRLRSPSPTAARRHNIGWDKESRRGVMACSN